MARAGPVTGQFTGNRSYLGNVNFAQGAAGASFNFVKQGTNIWYVDSGKTSGTSGGGTTWDTAFMTLLEAVTKAGAYDTILIAPNSIQTIASGGITITQDGLKIFGAGSSEAGKQSALKLSAGTSPMFTITADRVEIAGLNLSCRIAYPAIQIGDTNGLAHYFIHIHDCFLDGYGTATWGITNGPTASDWTAQADSPGLVVENCYFSSFATAAIDANGTEDTYRNNTIHVATDTIGIDVSRTGGGRNPFLIIDNLFYGLANASTTAIKFAGNTTVGGGIVARNLLAGSFNTTISNNTGDAGVENYQGTT
ncbi:hypothetical protein LCGC14_2747130, partial [marine sediment metagenome]